MNKLLKRIFDEIIIYERDYIEMDAGIDKEIEKYLMEYKGKMNQEEMENLKNLLYGITKISEQEGFFLGWRYAVRVFLMGKIS